MMKKRFYLQTLLVLSLITLLYSCGEDNRDNKESIRNLETNIKSLEDIGKINTFPLTIVVADKIPGEYVPANLQSLCALSKYNCKTLPIAGILRLGSNNYYEYNCISSLIVPERTRNNEADFTDTIERQVKGFLSSVKLRTYDSLLTENHEDWNLKTLSVDYISNSTDSIFFFSERPVVGSGIQVGNKSYPVFMDVVELRRKIDELICKGQKTISVFYNPAPFDTSHVAVPGTRTKIPVRGTRAGDTCVDRSKFEKLNDGSGGFITGKLIELNSKSCGFAYPTGRAGDTCIRTSKFEKLHNGKGGFTVGALIEKNSKDCGFVFPTGRAGDTCVSGSKFQRLHNGKGGFAVGELVERNSRSCGFVYPTGVAGDTCVSGSKYQKLHNGRGGFRRGQLLERNSKDCGFKYPAVGTVAEGFICEKTSKYAKLHDGKGGFIRGVLIEANSRDCGFVPPVTKPVAPPVTTKPVTTKPVTTKPATTTPPVTTKPDAPAPRVTQPKTVTPRTTAPTAEPDVTGPSGGCASRSDLMCEKDNSGNYTGRRVQYCYDKNGRILRTIVIRKCDSDCRCLGR